MGLMTLEISAVLFLMFLVLCLTGCAGEQLSTVQGDWRQLWHDPAMPTAVAEPPK
jgi:hypothetical protein